MLSCKVVIRIVRSKWKLKWTYKSSGIFSAVKFNVNRLIRSRVFFHTNWQTKGPSDCKNSSRGLQSLLNNATLWRLLDKWTYSAYCVACWLYCCCKFSSLNSHKSPRGSTPSVICTQFDLPGSNDDWHKWECVLCVSCFTQWSGYVFGSFDGRLPQTSNCIDNISSIYFKAVLPSGSKLCHCCDVGETAESVFI